MKSLSLRLGVILIGLAIFTYGEVWGADWKVFDKEIQRFIEGDPSFTGKPEYKRLYYYDRESIARPSKGIVKVWTKFVDQRETKSKEEANNYIQKRNSEEEEDFLKKSKFKNEKEKERARIGFPSSISKCNTFRFRTSAL